MSAMPLSVMPVVIGFALHIAGCAAPLSPEAQCFAEATAEYRTAWRTARDTRAALDRGYALHEIELARAAAVPCRMDGALRTCLHEAKQTVALPAPIDRAALERRLAASEARMEALRPAAMERAAPCGYAEALALASQEATQPPARP